MKVTLKIKKRLSIKKTWRNLSKDKMSKNFSNKKR